MSAEKIIRTLLAASSPVVSVVSDRIYPGELPQGTALPAIGVTHITTTELSTLDASAAFMLVATRIECVILAKDYATVKSLISAVRTACNYAHGSIAGFMVSSVRREMVGVDMRDSSLGIYGQTIDFMVTWAEPNT